MCNKRVLLWLLLLLLLHPKEEHTKYHPHKKNTNNKYKRKMAAHTHSEKFSERWQRRKLQATPLRRAQVIYEKLLYCHLLIAK